MGRARVSLAAYVFGVLGGAVESVTDRTRFGLVGAMDPGRRVVPALSGPAFLCAFRGGEQLPRKRR